MALIENSFLNFELQKLATNKLNLQTRILNSFDPVFGYIN